MKVLKYLRLPKIEPKHHGQKTPGNNLFSFCVRIFESYVVVLINIIAHTTDQQFKMLPFNDLPRY